MAIPTQYWISINPDGTLKESFITPNEDPTASLPFNSFEVTETQYNNMHMGYIWDGEDAVEPPPECPECPPEPEPEPPEPEPEPDPCECPPDPETEEGLTWEDVYDTYDGYLEYWVAVDENGYLRVDVVDGEERLAYLLVPNEDPNATLPFNAFQVTQEQFSKLFVGWIWQDGDTVEPPPDSEAEAILDIALETATGEELLNLFKSLMKRCIGCRVYTEENVVTSGENITESIDALDIAIGDVGTKIIQVIDTPVDTSTTVDVDSVQLIGTKSVKWIVTVDDATNIKTMTFEVLAGNKFNTDVTHTVYGRIGDWHIQYAIDVVVDTGNIVLRFTNNEAHELKVSYSRIITN